MVRNDMLCKDNVLEKQIPRQTANLIIKTQQNLKHGAFFSEKKLIPELTLCTDIDKYQ